MSYRLDAVALKFGSDNGGWPLTFESQLIQHADEREGNTRNTMHGSELAVAGRLGWPGIAGLALSVFNAM